MNSIHILRLQLEDLNNEILRYEAYDKLDNEERAKPHPEMNSFLSHQTMRSQCRDRIIAVTAAIERNARTIY